MATITVAGRGLAAARNPEGEGVWWWQWRAKLTANGHAQWGQEALNFVADHASQLPVAPWDG